MTGALKYDAGKPDLTLIPWDTIALRPALIVPLYWWWRGDRDARSAVDAMRPAWAADGRDFVADAAAAFNYGAGKYGAWNWEKGLAARRIYAAACRHYHAIERGEPADPESGLDHHCHLAACAVMAFGATPEPCPAAEP